ncbi:hypothetical protein G7054_g9526 [Neopestalotiopsis clavispora]|nr:hypothetical protein G7054_g9526 [Neopestalotiopsis clavispora]
MAVKTTSEVGRGREMFKYAASQLVGVEYQTHAALIESSSLRTSRDTVLTSLAELVALRLNVARVTISLFDQRWQYVVAEATPRLTLAPSAKIVDGGGLLLCGTAVPRSQSICSQVVKRTLEDAQVLGGDDLPLFIINDVSPHFEGNSYFKNWPHSFYAAVPIQTPRGIDIGALGIYGDHPNVELDEVAVLFMQDISRTIMEYLSAVRAREGQRRADRMVRGVGSFVEGEATLSGWRDSTNTESFQDNAGLAEGALNAKQQSIQQHQHSSGKTPSDTTQDEEEVNKAKPVSPRNEKSPSADNDTDSDSNSVHSTFAKAANILRESMEIEGVLFLDASISSFGGSIRRGNSRHGSSSSSDDSPNSTSLKDPDIPCSALGFSNSSESSIDGSLKSHGRVSISEKLLGKFIKKYPKGNIFNYDENGTLSSSESASEDNKSTTRKFLYPGDHASDGRARPSIVKRDSSFQKTGAATLITQLFPGARSVAFIPIWDTHKQIWFSGGFIYTKSPSRTFTTEGELSYFSAFSSIVMAEVYRGREAQTNQSKTDLLGSLSHELRSPLHGVVLGAELLQDTDLDIFQKDVLNTIENCCRTLVGTIDHLLDWTKINKFKQSSAVEMQNGRRPRRRGTSDGVKTSIETGMMTTTSQVDVAAIAEQVVESIFAGHTFQTMSVMRMVEGSGSTGTMTDAIRALDGIEALENMTTRSRGDSSFHIVFGGVVVTLSIDPHLPWAFATQPGALRRILMNLIGNSLRFTKQGFVEIRMGQESLRGRQSNSRLVVITVADTGRGIGQEFLKHQLFKAFAQEDALGAGAGLGLSLVKKITTSLHGSITAQSEPGEGCTMTVKLPLRVASLSNAELDEAEADFSANITELQGLRVAITGYPSSADQSFQDNVKEGLLRERSTLVEVCNNWLRMYVVEPYQTAEFIPDLILCGERSFEQSLKELRADEMTPTVVICRNALVARRMATSPKYSIRACNGVIDFISQPVGPRKLAKVLLQCFKHWTKLQETAISTQAPSVFTQSESMASPLEEPRDLLFAQSARSAPEAQVAPGASPRPRSLTAPERHPIEEHVTSPSLSHRNSDQDAETPRPSQAAIAPKPVEEEAGGERPRQNMEIRLKRKTPMARFLLVDDNAINLKILTAYMGKLGHRYDTARNGLEAFEAFQKGAGQYKCVLMDISMPVMDGFESSRRIRAHERAEKLTRCNIFALTGLASENAQQEAFSSGIDLCLAKPVKLKELSEILDEKKIDE